MSVLKVHGLYNFVDIARLSARKNLTLSDATNREIICHIISKIGITVGVKIAYKSKIFSICPNT